MNIKARIKRKASKVTVEYKIPVYAMLWDESFVADVKIKYSRGHWRKWK